MSRVTAPTVDMSTLEAPTAPRAEENFIMCEPKAQWREWWSREEVPRVKRQAWFN